MNFSGFKIWGINKGQFETKKNVDLNFVYVSEVSPNTIASYTSKSPRGRRERSTFTLDASLIFGEISETRIKQTLFS